MTVTVAGATKISSSNSSSITPNLPFGDINLIVLTDVHSWVGGHGKSEAPNLDVSYGDVVSFYERLKAHCSSDNDNDNGNDNDNDNGEECGDIWLVQNGDWIDGTGLATDGDPSALIPLLEKIPFDVLNTGNHELYQDSVIEEMRKPGGFLQWWGHRHLASNVYMKKKNTTSRTRIMGEPMSNRYTVLEGKRSTVLVFGFIYNLPNPSDLVVVQNVEDAVKEDWFHTALTEVKYDAILVMLHAGHDDPSVEAIRTEIRKVTAVGIDENGNLPIQFIAGHTHYRRYAVADPQSTVVEAGRYMDTVGWVSFPNANTIQKEKQKEGRRRQRRRQKRMLEEANNSKNSTDNNNNNNNTNMNDSTPNTTSSNATTPITTKINKSNNNSVTDLFQHVFLDANIATLRNALGIFPSSNDNNNNDNDDDDFQTPYGKEVSAFIEETQQTLGLTRKIGCASRDYSLNVSMAQENSLWRLYRDEVGPHVLGTMEFVGDADDDGETTKNISSSSSSSFPSAVVASNRALFMSQDSWRYGLYGGNHLTYDDVIVVSPFNEPIYRVAVLPCHSMLQLNQSMNANLTGLFYSPLPAWILSGQREIIGPDDHGHGSDYDYDCELYVNHFGLSRVQDGLRKIRPDDVVNEPIETNLTTTSIWFSFIADQWQCPDSNVSGDGLLLGNGNDSHNDNSLGLSSSSSSDDKIPETMNTSTGVIVVKIAIAFIILCIVTICSRMIRHRKRKDHYGGVMLDSFRSSNTDNDGEDILHEGQYCDADDDDDDDVDNDGNYSDSDPSDGFCEAEDNTNEEEPHVQIV